VVDLRVAAGIRIDGRRRNVADVLAKYRAVDVAVAGAHVVQIVDHIDQPAHFDVTGNGQPARDDDHSFKYAAGVCGETAVDGDTGKVRCRCAAGAGGSVGVVIDVVARHRVDEDDAVWHLVACVERQPLDPGAVVIGPVLLCIRLESVQVRILEDVRVKRGTRYVRSLVGD